MITGKTLICKQRAIQQAEKCENPVYYISLLASDVKGRPDRPRLIFDLLTEVEFNNKEVIFLDIEGLMQERNTAHDGADVYDLVEIFIKENRGADVIIDECPFLREYGNYGG